jgi:hypothetical protein
MFIKNNNNKFIIFAASILASSSTLAVVPAGYYNSVDTINGQALHSTLHEIIDDHQRFPYTSTATDTWDILETADQDPDNANNVIDIYKKTLAILNKVVATLSTTENTVDRSLLVSQKMVVLTMPIPIHIIYFR